MQVSENLKIERHSDNPIQDFAFKIEDERRELARLQFQRATLLTPEQVDRAIALQKEIIAKLEQERKEAEASKNVERLALLEAMRKSLPHGDLLENIVFEDGVRIYQCRKHPGRRITNWWAHVSAFGLHPEFRENNPVNRRRRDEQLQREREAEQREVEAKFNEQQTRKADFMEKNGYISA